MPVSLLVRLIAILIGILSTLYLARSGFNFTIAEFLTIVLDEFDRWLAFALKLFGPLISTLLAWLNGWLKLELVLQPHWRHVFALLWLFIGTSARVSGAQLKPAPRVLLWLWAWTCAIVFGVLAGCAPLANPSLVLWAAAGYCLFFSIRRPALLLLVAAFAYSTTQFPSTSVIGASLTSSLGLVLLTIGVAVVGVVNLLIGVTATERDAEVSSDQKPNQNFQVGVDILSVLGGAAAMLALSEALPSRVQSTTKYSSDSIDEEFRDCDTCPLMKKIPGGTFLMGSDIATWKRVVSENKKYWSWEHGEVPKHSVSLQSFSMSASEITKDQYAAFVAATKHDSGGFCWGMSTSKSNFDASFNWRNPSFDQDGNHPVVCVSWWDAKSYVKWLSAISGKLYRLPSEAEWEYAARAGSGIEWYWGEDASAICRYANVKDSSQRSVDRYRDAVQIPFDCNDRHPFTSPVRSYSPNEFGLYDMIGNVDEWTEDCLNLQYVGAPTDGTPWLSGRCDVRVARGGSWDAWTQRETWSVSRYGTSSPTWKSIDRGIRVVRNE